jgi:dipeptidase D
MAAQVDSPGIEALDPAPMWRFFAGIAAVPRCSKKEQQARDHVRGLGERMGLTVREDAAGNIVIEVPATPGCENAPITVIQGHLDMVCEKNSATEHDFTRDPIRPVVDQDPRTGEQFVRADGTTLGADNGIGLAMALAAASEPGVRHGPLELLFTVDEEAGMSGAKVLEPNFIRGKRMLNLDAEEDDVIYIGCAGGCDVTLTWEFKAASPPAGAEICKLSVKGLRGGHSGGDIHLNRANANRLLVETLRRTGRARLQLAGIKGGSLRNVIPREAHALLPASAKMRKALHQAAQAVQAEAVRSNGEESCAIQVEKATMDESPLILSPADTRRVLGAVASLPHGVLAVVPEIPGLVQTSNNVATIASERSDGKLQVTLGCLSRSSSKDQLHATVRQIVAVGQLAGAQVEWGNEYPGWQPNVDSPLLATCRRVYEELFGEAPNATAIHAGVECGIIGERIGGMDMVSFGPRIEGAHSPDERVYVASVQKSWKYLTAVLAELAKG